PEGLDAVRADSAARQLVADLNLGEARRNTLAVRQDPVVPNPGDFGQFLGRPDGARGLIILVHLALFGLGDQVADRGAALLGDERAVLVAVNRIAAGDQGRTGEFAFHVLVIV